uniref:Dynein regulatory complex protein 10 n=1 Tax=Mesocestoides corti TaxID=53468 RepID=A0A5K3FBK8_MESCO
MELEVESKSRVRDVYRKFARKYSENRQQFESKMQLLGEDLEQVKTEFTEHRDKAKRDRQGLRRQLNKSGEVVAMCLNNMDDKLFDLELRYGVVMKKYEELSKEHEALLTEFQPIKEEYDGVMELRRQEEEERQRLAREKAEMIQAATFIQSLYRSWKTRKEIKKAGRKMR